MDYLETIFNEEEIDDLYEVYNESFLSSLDGTNIRKITEYLKSNGVWFYTDIISEYLDLFILPYDEFVKKFELLKEEHPRLIELLELKLDLLESMR